MNEIKGGVCAPKGFQASGVHAGIRYKEKDRKDLALIVSDKICAAAAVYTQNKVKGAPIAVTKKHLSDGRAKAMICNSGNANTCAPDGEAIAKQTCQLAAEQLGIQAEDVIICSTGVIGEPMSIVPFEAAMEPLAKALSYSGGAEAAQAIMTTDTIQKEYAVEFDLGGKPCRIGATAKGSGMIHPDMATMLSFITTDAAISPQMLQEALGEDIKDSYNQLSVDGDTSTNDTVAIMANGMAANKEICSKDTDYEIFCKGLSQVTRALVKMLAKDGEGASKLIECNVDGAPDLNIARAVAKTVVSSDLLKCAVFGEDANWGRVLCALGYAPGDFNAEQIDVTISSQKGVVAVCKNSAAVGFSEAQAAEILKETEIVIAIEMNQGDASASAWGCDLTYEYVKINGDYRS